MNNNSYNVRITFTSQFTCWYNDLEKFFSENIIPWENFNQGNKLYYASESKYAEYDFYIIHIDHNKKIVELGVVPEE